MHPVISQFVIRARIADLHKQARRARRARVVRDGRRDLAEGS